MTRPPACTLTLTPDPPGPDRWGRTPDVRLRLAVKHLGRLFGLRVVAVRPAGDAPPSTPEARERSERRP